MKSSHHIKDLSLRTCRLALIVFVFVAISTSTTNNYKVGLVVNEEGRKENHHPTSGRSIKPVLCKS